MSPEKDDSGLSAGNTHLPATSYPDQREAVVPPEDGLGGTQECELCREFTGAPPYFAAELLSVGLSTRVLSNHNGIVILVGVGPLLPGYVLLLPEGHHTSLATTPAHTLDALLEQKLLVTRVFRELYGSVTCFEHGAGSCGAGSGACIDHAHLHLIPGTPQLRIQARQDFEEVPIAGIRELPHKAAREKRYLFLEDDKGCCFLYHPTTTVPSQYFRRYWAKAVGRDYEWDWGVFPNFFLMRQTFLDLIPHLKIGESGTTPAGIPELTWADR